MYSPHHEPKSVSDSSPMLEDQRAVEQVHILARRELMDRLRKLIKHRELSQNKAAKLLGVSQPRVAEIMGMKIEKFSVELLIRYLARLGCKVSFVNLEGEID